MTYVDVLYVLLFFFCVDLLIVLTVAERYIKSVFAIMSTFGQMGKVNFAVYFLLVLPLCRMFPHDVTATRLVFQTSPLGIELYFYAKIVFCFRKPKWLLDM